MKKEEALDRFSTSRRRLQETIADLDETDLTGHPVEGIWSIKDLLGHITAWEQTLIAPVAAFAAGGSFRSATISNHDAWNHAQAAGRSSASIAQIQEELDAKRQELLANLEKLSDSQWEGSFQAPWGGQNTILEMISGLAWHEEEHTKSILKFLSNKRS